jgi:single-strand DNA-binding protein
MKTVNRLTLLGAVGGDPEMRYTASGMAVATFSLATEETSKNKEKTTSWHNCVAFDKLAEIVGQYVKKGSKLYCEGKIQYQQYEKDGEKRMATKIVVNDISMLSPATESNHQSTAQKGRGTAKASTQAQEFEDSEIPF